MKKIAKIIYYWLPPFIWMYIIFHFSSYRRVSVSTEYAVNFYFFKSLHVAEYALLYFLFFRAFYSLRKKVKSLNLLMIIPFVFCVLYAGTDEFHQTFILTRQGRPRDVLIDIVGMSIMYIYIRLFLPWLKKVL
ncbi:VanZ family protein [Candidatus Roizmanbacteria bacterium]|jgi:VanZ family protein|nr:VanZ family protein [Candidatus Roizmanbacteria bacterium]